MSDTLANPTLAERAATVTPLPVARRIRRLSDRAIAWLFIAPTILLLLAINIFPLIWTIHLSFTNYRANRPNAAGRERRHPQLRAHPHRPRHLACHAGDGAFRVLDDRASRR